MTQYRNVVGRLWQADRERGRRIQEAMIARPVPAALAGALLGAIIGLISALQDPQHSTGLVSSVAGSALGGFLGAGAVILLFRWFRKTRERRSNSQR